ncbi:hypothetical protein [Streptomyces sp. NPDC002133]|uniref:hypothetical protein n=1 Tax=Streptomyces sp. NPDC002133 TaxID=3154409 RepID=UPI003332571D
MLARQDYADIMDGLRTGRIWVGTGDLITSLELTAGNRGSDAAMGETLTVSRRHRTDVEIEIRFRPLEGKNANGDRPEVRRVDLLVGQIAGPSAGLDNDTNPTAEVVARFGPSDWRKQGKDSAIRHTREPWKATSTPGCAAPALTRPHPSLTGWRALGAICGST